MAITCAGYAPDWVVTRISRSKVRDRFYPWVISGLNLNTGLTFIWHLPDIAWCRFDVSAVQHGADLITEAQQPNNAMPMHACECFKAVA